MFECKLKLEGRNWVGKTSHIILELKTYFAVKEDIIHILSRHNLISTAENHSITPFTNQCLFF